MHVLLLHLGIVSLESCANLDLDVLHQYDGFNQLDHAALKLISEAIVRLREKLKFVNWLKRSSLQKYAIKLFDMGIDSIRKVVQISEAKLNELTSHDITGRETEKLKAAIKSLLEEIEDIANSIWNNPVLIYASSILYPGIHNLYTQQMSLLSCNVKASNIYNFIHP